MTVLKILPRRNAHVNEDLKDKEFSSIMSLNAKTEAGTSVFQEIGRSTTFEANVNGSIVSAPLDFDNKRVDMSNQNLGFIQIPRSLLDHNCWCETRIIYKHIFMTILENCVYKTQIFYSGTKEIVLQPGQFCTTFRGLVELVNKKIKYEDEKIDLPLVQRAVSKFTQLGLSIHHTIHDKTIITITHPDTCEFFKDRIDTPSATSSIQDRYSKEESKEGNTLNNPLSPSLKKSRKSKKVFEEKFEVATGVNLKATEKEEILKRLNGSEEDFKKCVTKLSEYKISSGKVYSSDFLAILKWVINWLKDEKLKPGGGENSAEFHKKIADKIEKKYSKHSDITIGYNYVEFKFGSMNVRHLKFGENAFIEQVENCLRKLELDFSSITRS